MKRLLRPEIRNWNKRNYAGHKADEEDAYVSSVHFQMETDLQDLPISMPLHISLLFVFLAAVMQVAGFSFWSNGITLMFAPVSSFILDSHCFVAPTCENKPPLALDY